MAHDSTVCATSFLLGGLTGAALAVLYAPRRGSETRQLVADKAARAQQTAGQLKDRMVSRGREVYEQVSEKGNELVDKGSDLVSRGRRAAERIASGSANEPASPDYAGVGEGRPNRWTTADIEGQG